VSYTLILIFSILFNHLILLKIIRSACNKNWLYFGIGLNITLLFIFKYLDFFLENINLIFFDENSHARITEIGIVLPLGISFFTFQQISMLVDTYRDPNSVRPSLIKTSLYVSFFPQLIAGPIIRYKDVISQIGKRKENLPLMHSGIQRFIIGLFKKVVLANGLAVIATEIMDTNPVLLNTGAAWLGIIAYTLQIFFDFSGYSDMAIGLGRVFGFRFLENFNMPYIASSMQDFWRRWHISLSNWFRDYVYIPLGGNKKGVNRTYINLIIVFLLTGFWHGATWSFVFWGAFHGLFLIIERLGFQNILKKAPSIISWIYTISIVMFGWVFFRIEDIHQAFNYIKVLLGFDNAREPLFFRLLNLESVLILVISLILSLNFFNLFNKTFKRLSKQFRGLTQIKDLALILMFIICVMYINSGSYSPFIYFRF
jgi:alginate O-acetyltransferase complex protein AlgI